MKKTILTIAVVAVCLSASAQNFQQDKTNPSMMDYQMAITRSEIITPEVNGFKVIKTDLHVHTYYSDGGIAPAQRVLEAWYDGLDAIAITDHIEYRPTEKDMAKYLKVDVPESEKWDPKADLNVPVKIAAKAARHYGITVISGIEITRSAQKVGHFCALFTKDNNQISDKDPLQAIRNAKMQGTLIQANHPGWRCKSNEFTPVAKAALAEGLVDGVEVFNGNEFYPDVIERGVENNLYIAGNTDIHPTTHEMYGRNGCFRNMTLVLAKDSSAESIREGLENKRTLAYSFGAIAGPESLLCDFFKASVDVKLISIDSKKNIRYLLTNKTSFKYSLRVPGKGYDIPLDPMSSVIIKTKAKEMEIGVMNMWTGADKHPSVKMDIIK